MTSVLRSCFRNSERFLIYRNLCFGASIESVITVHIHTHTHIALICSYFEVSLISKLKWKFESQVYPFRDTQSAPLPKVGCLLGTKRPRLFSGARDLGVPFPGTSSFFIISECHHHLRVGTQQPLLTLSSAPCI